jgi:hypothetical protein
MRIVRLKLIIAGFPQEPAALLGAAPQVPAAFYSGGWNSGKDILSGFRAAAPISGYRGNIVTGADWSAYRSPHGADDARSDIPMSCLPHPSGICGRADGNHLTCAIRAPAAMKGIAT